MARTKAAARKAPRTGAAGPVTAEDDVVVEEAAAVDDDGLDEEDAHNLLVATLRELRALKLVAPHRHSIQRVDNTGPCGMPECKVAGCRLACVDCRVRLCRNTWCWNQHINDNRGDTINQKTEFRISEDQGEHQSVPGRARERPQPEAQADALQ